MFEVCESQERRVVLIDELATCADAARARAITTELDELAKKYRMVAFRSHSEEDQDRFQLAATYSDEWVKGETPNGPFWVRMFLHRCERIFCTRAKGRRSTFESHLDIVTWTDPRSATSAKQEGIRGVACINMHQDARNIAATQGSVSK